MIYDHQKVGIDFLKKAKYGLLADEQGLGKTMQAIKAVESVKGIRLIVCPAFLRGTWQREIEKFTGDEALIVSKTKMILPDTGWVIMSYDFIHKYRIIPQAVVFDECHYLKNMDAKRTQRAHNLVMNTFPEFCILLSGTPIKNSLTEFYSPLRMLSYCPFGTNGDKIKEVSQYGFSTRFSNPRIKTVYRPGGREIEVREYHGSRNVPQLKKYLKGKYLRRLSKNVLSLPEIIDREIYLDNIPKGLAAGLEKCYLAHEAGKKSKDENFATFKKEFSLRKVKATVTLADDLITEGEQIVIFSDHVLPCSVIASQLETKGWKTRVITGDVSHEDRDKIVSLFQTGDLDCIVATIGSASTGFTLTAASNIIFNDIPWSFVDLSQARKRIHRVGQDKRCVINYILGGEIDKRILKRVKDKGKNLKEVL